MKNKRVKRMLIISVCLLGLWSILGTQASLAWFTDSTPVDRNVFLVGNMELQVSYKHDGMNDYAIMDETTAVFNDEALYEPNYTQVVYLKIENTGNVDFNYRLLVDTYDYTDSMSVNDTIIHLPKYLKFGVIYGDSEPQLQREVAQSLATENRDTVLSQFGSLSNYYKDGDTVLTKNGVRYAAIIIYMPKEVGNEANHKKGVTPPQIQLGITVYAQQAGTPMN